MERWMGSVLYRLQVIEASTLDEQVFDNNGKEEREAPDSFQGPEGSSEGIDWQVLESLRTGFRAVDALNNAPKIPIFLAPDRSRQTGVDADGWKPWLRLRVQLLQLTPPDPSCPRVGLEGMCSPKQQQRQEAAYSRHHCLRLSEMSEMTCPAPWTTTTPD